MENKKGKLIIARHNESEWNKLGKWTGTRDRHLTEYGFKRSEDMGLLIKDVRIDQAFASMQVRTIETLSCMLNVCESFTVPIEHAAALNERDYGDLTGRNKWEMQELLGKDEFNKLRRAWDHPIPKGESLKMVYDRVVPFYLEKVLPLVKEGKNVLVVAHGNSLRGLVKYLENISDEGIADVEIPFGTISIYNLDEEGRMIDKEIRKTEPKEQSKYSKAQIVATLGPASEKESVLRELMEHQLDVIRLNFSWSDIETRRRQILLVRSLAKEQGKNIPIIIDLPGPRVQESKIHTYDADAQSALTEEDEGFIKFAAEMEVEYVAVSFVGSAEDIVKCREIIKNAGGSQKVIAKIERAKALESLDSIIDAADAIMVARGDLGSEIPLEQIPFVQERIVAAAKNAHKPVIVATQMMLSMVESPEPTRAEVTDVENAILQGADAVMLSEETTVGKHPVEVVVMMEKSVLEAEHHMGSSETINPL